mgnify:CR=1 FL=1
MGFLQWKCPLALRRQHFLLLGFGADFPHAVPWKYSYSRLKSTAHGEVRKNVLLIRFGLVLTP